MIAIPDPERALVLAYAARGKRPALAALWALDEALARIGPSVREPMIGRIRLAWWAEALARLDTAAAPAEPVLRALAAEVLPLGISGAELSELVECWDDVIAGAPLDDAAIELYARARGEALFRLAARVLGALDCVASAGRGWALVDRARADPAQAGQLHTLAAPLLARATRQRWSRAGRPLGALAQLARMEVEGRAPAWRVSRVAWHALTGR